LADLEEFISGPNHADIQKVTTALLSWNASRHHICKCSQ
jgi:hypothetical protein